MVRWDFSQGFRSVPQVFSGFLWEREFSTSQHKTQGVERFEESIVREQPSESISQQCRRTILEGEAMNSVSSVAAGWVGVGVDGLNGPAEVTRRRVSTVST